MKVLHAAAVAALSLVSSAAWAQGLPPVQRPTGSVVGVVQGQGSQRPVTDVHVNQNTQNNVAGVMQAGPNTSATINQTGGGNNVGLSTQMGRNNSTTLNQQGRNNSGQVRQTGRTNNAGVAQTGGHNRSGISQRQRP